MKYNKWLFIDVIVLMLFGLLMIYSSSSIWAEYKFGNKYHFLIYQSIFILIGVILMYILPKIKVSFYYKYATKILTISKHLILYFLI